MLYIARTVPLAHTHAALVCCWHIHTCLLGLLLLLLLPPQDGLEVKTKDKEMRRVLSLFQLSAFGISAIVGGGIFVVTGVQAKLNAG
jgi:hypothetical protein